MDNNVFFTFSKPTTFTPNSWPFDQQFFLILNIAIGGSWGGNKGIDNSIFPQRMVIDYVKVHN